MDLARLHGLSGLCSRREDGLYGRERRQETQWLSCRSTSSFACRSTSAIMDTHGELGFGPAERWNPIPRPSNLIWVMHITRLCISAAGRAALFMRNPRRSRRAVPNGHSGSCCVSGALQPNRRMVNLTSDGHRLCASNVISFAGLSAAVALGCRASPRDAFSLGHDGGSIG